MRDIAPSAVSAALAGAWSDMNTVSTYTVKTYTEGHGPFVPTAALSAAVFLGW